MIDKRVHTMADALEGLSDGASIMLSGFGGAGIPVNLMRGLRDHNAKNLTVIVNGMRYLETHTAEIFEQKRVVRAVTTSARGSGRDTVTFEQQWLDGYLQVEVAPQGSFVERIRAGGAGIAAFYTPTGVGTDLAKGKEVRNFDGKPHVLEYALTADFAFIRAQRADRWGNIEFHGSQANFGPAMASAARTTVVEVGELTEAPIEPTNIGIPGIHVQRVIQQTDHRDQA